LIFILFLSLADKIKLLILITRPRLHAMQRGKKQPSLHHCLRVSLVTLII